MQNFVQLWVYLAATPLFGLTATVSVYVAAQIAYQRLGQPPWANPVLWSVLLIGLLLTLTGTPYPSYFSGAQFIHFLLGPAVVALAWPLWLRRAELRARAVPILCAALAGGAAASLGGVAIGWALGLPPEVLASMAPKSVTAPVAMGIAQQLGGIPALAAVFALLTGLTGAIGAKYWFDLLRVQAPEVRGFALGSTSHGIGAARAMQVHPDAGAYAGLALGAQVVLASLLMPLAARLFF
ncbi:MAG TPA: LrgB family protein [Ideonella sp.]|nr:LrgB family protein [Ideonella sp.]